MDTRDHTGWIKHLDNTSSLNIITLHILFEIKFFQLSLLGHRPVFWVLKPTDKSPIVNFIYSSHFSNFLWFFFLANHLKVFRNFIESLFKKTVVNFESNQFTYDFLDSVLSGIIFFKVFFLKNKWAFKSFFDEKNTRIKSFSWKKKNLSLWIDGILASRKKTLVGLSLKIASSIYAVSCVVIFTLNYKW